jgi:hypothetical protein
MVLLLADCVRRSLMPSKDCKSRGDSFDAKEWEDSTEYRRKQLIEIMLFYSAIHEVQEL